MNRHAKKRTRLIPGLAAVVACLLAATLCAETITLRDGTEMNVRIVKRTATAITVDMEGVKFDVAVSDIESIDGKPLHPQAPAAAGAPPGKQGPIKKKAARPKRPAKTARHHKLKHPVLNLDLSRYTVSSLKSSVRYVMAMSDEELIEFNWKETDFSHAPCPNCTGGSQNSQLGWSITDPDHVKCKYCGMVFPNDKYPMDKMEEVVTPAGVKQRYPYHQDARGRRYFFRANILNKRRIWLREKALKLAILYRLTKEKLCAHKAALILARWAEVYPYLCVHGPKQTSGFWEPTFYKVKLVPAPPDGVQPVPKIFGHDAYYKYKTPYPYYSIRAGLGQWYYSEVPVPLVKAYDLIYDSGEIRKLSSTWRRDVRKEIEDFLRGTVNFTRTFPRYLGNMDPSLIRGEGAAGRVIGEPEFVHGALIRARLILPVAMFPDGMWRECTASYHNQTFHGLRYALSFLAGYSDPPGFTGREDGRHIENLDIEKEVPLLGWGDVAVRKLRFPSGEYACVHDTWAATTLNRERLGTAPLESSQPQLLWAAGHAVLGRGKADAQMQAHLHFSGAYGHDHRDTLNIILFAKGREMLSDIGYSHTVLRAYASSSLAHNLVLIDEQEQQYTKPCGSLIAFGAPNETIEYVEADGRAAYPELAATYRRALVLVGVSDTEGYAVDVFRVAGGNRHDYFIHGDCDNPQELTTTLDVKPREGCLLGPDATFKPWATERGRAMMDGRNNCYGLVQGLRAAVTDRTWCATFTYSGSPRKGLRVTMLARRGTEVILARTPSVRPAHENNAEIYKHQRATLVVRRKGKKLSNVFAAVHEPFEGDPFIRSVEPLGVQGGPMAVGLRIESSAGVDYHLLQPSAEARCAVKAESALSLTLTGRYGFVRVRKGKVVAAYLLDGTLLKFGTREIKVPRCPAGKVETTHSKYRGDDSDALIVSPAVHRPDGDEGRHVIVHFGDGTTYALEIDRIEKQAGKTVIHLCHEPGFEIVPGGARQTFFPHREIAGQVKFRIPCSIFREF